MSKTNYILIHGQLVEVSDEVLMHWKYIKREKKNGRWVYYYDEDAADREMKSLEAKYRQSQQDLKVATSRHNQAKAVLYADKSQKAKDEEQAARANYSRTARIAYEIENEYAKKKTSNFAARTLGKGAIAVANLFSKLFSKKK